MTIGTTRYHHGDLPNALRAAAVDVIDERGIAGFSLREVARRAGVSHNAPAHHFGDARGLLTSLAIEGFEALHDAAVAAARRHHDPVDRLMAIGTAYLELGRSHRAHCDVMFRVDLIDADDTEVITAGMRAYAVLEVAVWSLIDGEGLDVDLDAAVWLCWSAMQGLLVLEPKIVLISSNKHGGELSTAELVRRFTTVIVAGMRSAAATAR